MPLRIDDGKVLEKYKTIWTKDEDWRNIKLKHCQFMILDI